MLLPHSSFGAVYETIRDTAADDNRRASRGAGAGAGASSYDTEGGTPADSADSGGAGASAGCFVLLLVAPTADAVCACKMLTVLLMHDEIKYRVRPVAGFGDLQREVAHACESSIVLLDCGAVTPLNLLRSPPRSTLYVIDSHLPVYHTNVHERSKVVVLSWLGDRSTVPAEGDEITADRYFDDDFGDVEDENRGGDEVSDSEGEGKRPGPSPGERKPSDTSPAVSTPPILPEGGADAPGSGAGASAEAGASPDSASPGRTASALSLSTAVTVAAKRKRLRKEADAEIDEGDGDDKSSGSDESGSEQQRQRRQRQRRAEEGKRASEQALRRQLRDTVTRYRKYYCGHGFGMPVSFFIFELAAQMNRCRADLQWLACVGVTSHLVQEQLAKGDYCDMANKLRDSIVGRSFGGLAVCAGAGTECRPVDELGEAVHAGRDGYILCVREEPRFVLHRHWNLYEAMQASDFVSTRLNLHGADSGLAQLDKLIAKTGVRREQLRQSYSHMPRKERVDFFAAISKQLDAEESWKMQSVDLFYPSFVRYMEMESPRSAADVVNSINGLLAAGDVAPGLLDQPNRHMQQLHPRSRAVGTGAGAGAGPGSAGLEDESAPASNWKDAFFTAFSSLSSLHSSTSADGRGEAGSDLFERGVANAKVLRQAVMRVAPVLVRQGRVHCGSRIRWVEVGDDLTDAELRLFAQPLALAALGRQLVRLHRDAMLQWRSIRGRDFPVVLTLRHSRATHAGEGVGGTGTNNGGSLGWVTVLGMPVTSTGEGHAPPMHNLLDAFTTAGQYSRAKFLLESFDSATLVLDARDLPAFMHELDPAAARKSTARR